MANYLSSANISDTTAEYYNSTAATDIVRITTSDIWLIITFALRYLETMFAFVGNSLVLVAVSRFEYLRTPTGWLICGLSMSNLMLTFLTPVTHFLIHPRITPTTRYVCLFKLIFMTIFIFGNLLFSLLIGLERLITLSFPLMYATIITNRRVIIVFNCAWACLLMNCAWIPISSYKIIMSSESLNCNPAVMLTKLTHLLRTVELYGLCLGKNCTTIHV